MIFGTILKTIKVFAFCYSAYHYQHIIDIFLVFCDCQALSMVQSIQPYTRAALLSILY